MNHFSSDRAAVAPSPLAPIALLAACGAALVGALVWAGIGFVTGYEVGYVAWAVGGMVGFATVACGGRGMTMATVASFITLFGILSGKLLTTHFIVQNEIAGAWEDAFTTEVYEELKLDGVDFAALGANPTDETVWAFMIDHEYTEHAGPVDPGGIAWFNEHKRAQLMRFQPTAPDFREWREQSLAAEHEAFSAELSIVAAMVEGLDPIDLLFTFLAISTAFGMIRRSNPASEEIQVLATSEDTRRAA